MSPTRAKHADRKTERRLNTPLLPISVAVFAVLYVLTGYRGWLVFVIGLGGAWLLAAWWVYSLEQALTIKRSIHLGWASVGDSVPEQLEVTNKGRFPAIWLEIVDESDTLLEPLRLVTDVERDATRRRNPVHRFKRRGLYTLGPTRLRTGDPFGVYTLTVRDQHASTIMVTPPQLSLAQLRISAGGWAGDLKRRRGALVREISDAGIRDYMPGDSLKRIHWQASAHHDSLVVRQLEAATAEDWWIFVDLEAAVQSGIGQDSTLELSIVLAASLAMRGLKEHRRVGMALVGPRLTWLEPRVDLAHRWKILRALAMAEAGNRSLAELLPRGRPSQTASLIVITPSTNPAWVSAVDPRHRSGSTTVLLVDPTDFGSGLDQGNVASALARSRIPYRRMPGSLLGDAYSSSGRAPSQQTPSVDPGRRYLQRTGAAWQSMD